MAADGSVRDVPIPPRRPAEWQVAPAPSSGTVPASAGISALPATPARPTIAPSPSADEVAACDKLLATGTVKADRLPPIAPGSACAIAVPVKLRAVSVPGEPDLRLEPAVTLRCAMAGAVADWIRSDLAPLLARRGGMATLSGLGGYACRSRDNIPGAKLSEHALGDAMDIGAFAFRDGRQVKVTDVSADVPFFAAVKLTACARFATVLGPGADAYHTDHMHVDIEARRNSRHLCQWQLP